ncbi:hypothetical protein VQ045_12220 [Aurantimonas sp. E1-2-R+4]|uniref:hypothetical protein n=1 Tax=Aurantimonas sp. E1-2-R+4 TaxID=3113714 RepID=UPI002F93869A
MKRIWLLLMAAILAFAPIMVVAAQDSGAAGEAAADKDDDDDDDDGATGAAMVPTAEELTIPKGSELMPASALNGDQIGLPPVSLSSQIVTPLVLGAPDREFAVSHTDIYLRANQAYRWDIASEGGLEYKFHAPGFFRNVWMNQIVISDLEVHMAGPPAWLEFDATGVITVQFQTTRPGRYDWYVEGLDEEQDMKGTITIVP